MEWIYNFKIGDTIKTTFILMLIIVGTSIAEWIAGDNTILKGLAKGLNATFLVSAFSLYNQQAIKGMFTKKEELDKHTKEINEERFTNVEKDIDTIRDQVQHNSERLSALEGIVRTYQVKSDLDEIKQESRYVTQTKKEIEVLQQILTEHLETIKQTLDRDETV